MPQKEGAYLGSVRDLGGLMERCFVSGECWHLRSPRGKPMPKERTHVLWVHQMGGKMSATRAAWFLKTGEHAPKSRTVVRVCDSYDCVNPEHLRCWTKKQWGAWLAKTGRSKTPAKTIAAKRNAARRSRLTPDDIRTIVMAKSAKAGAEAVGIAGSYAITIRKRHSMDIARMSALEAA